MKFGGKGVCMQGASRQFQPDSGKWVVTYFSSPGVSTSPGTWLGKKKGEDIVLTMAQKAPNGMDGFSRLTFHSISPKGYGWKGEWVSQDESIVYPFWIIGCNKRSSD